MIAAIVALPIVVGIIALAAGSGDEGTSISFPGIKKTRAALVRVEGTIFQPEKTLKLLREYCDDKSIAGVLLLVNSPGGGVAASQEIYREVLRYKQTNKPLVVSMQSVAASGGYYISAPARKIFADAGTTTGSIGVIARWPRFKGLFDKVGIEMVTMKAGKFKDMGNPDREMTTEEKAMMQTMLETHRTRFIDDICAARTKISCDSLKAIADGRVFTGDEAVKVGLVDTIGNLEDASDYLIKISGLPAGSKLVEKKPKRSIWEALLPDEITHLLYFSKELTTPAGCYYLYEF
jgi:protease-4